MSDQIQPTVPVSTAQSDPNTNPSPLIATATESGTQSVVDPLLTDKMQPEDLDDRWTSWKCLQCGYVYEGQQSVSKCPRCGNEDPDKFD